MENFTPQTSEKSSDGRISNSSATRSRRSLSGNGGVETGEDAAESRAARDGFLKSDRVRANLPRIQELNAIAEKGGQSLAQMAIAWVLRLPAVTSALLGASSVTQLEENLKALDGLEFSDQELAEIESILSDES